MSKPKRMPIGTSENLFKGLRLFSSNSHSCGIKGVLMISRLLCNNGAQLCGV